MAKKQIRPDDEILWTEEDGDLKDKENITVKTFKVFFADGTRLEINSIVPIPPESEMNEQDITHLYEVFSKEPPKKVTSTILEIMELEQASTAYRALSVIQKMLERKIPEREKEACPLCGGTSLCPYCRGKGCADCNNTLACSNCKGRGWVFSESKK